MPFFSKPTYSTISVVKKKDIPKDLYTRCPKSGELVYTKELEKNLNVLATLYFSQGKYTETEQLFKRRVVPSGDL